MNQFRITPLNRPVEDFGKWRTEITPEMRAESVAYQEYYDALRAQFVSEWVPPPGYSRAHDLEEMENIQSAAFDVWQERREGRTAAATTPNWMDAFDYWLIEGSTMDDSGILGCQPTAASMTLPFVLKGGGDMQITFETEKYLDTNFHPNPSTRMASKSKLVVRTEHGVFKGYLKREYGERSWLVISLPPNAPQDVADRIATTLDAIQKLDLAEDYLAVMPVSNRCSFCSRPLSDIVSKTLGIGPDCAAKWKIPHSAAVADAIIVKRHAFLVEEVTS